jgi:DNA primase
MFLRSSGSGKTYLQEKISELIPQEEKIEITRITENALYYFKQHELEPKLILIEDLDGALSVFYPLRELQTAGSKAGRSPAGSRNPNYSACMKLRAILY